VLTPAARRFPSPRTFPDRITHTSAPRSVVARTPSCPRSTACGLTSIQARDTSIRVARREVKRQLAAIPEAEERLILATGRYIGEGFDDARLDTLFLALPVSWKGTLIQYAGRLHRLHPAKQEVRIFDYVDREVPVLLRMFQKRLRGYRGIDYARREAPLGLGEPGDDIVVEYDEEVLRSLKQRD